MTAHFSLSLVLTFVGLLVLLIVLILVVLLIVLMVISIAIGISPIVDYFHANGAEEEITTSLVETSDTAPVTSEDTAPREPGLVAVLSAVVLATGTILISLVLFIKQRDPEA